MKIFVFRPGRAAAGPETTVFRHAQCPRTSPPGTACHACSCTAEWSACTTLTAGASATVLVEPEATDTLTAADIA